MAKRVHIERNREESDLRLWNDYFSETSTYRDEDNNWVRNVFIKLFSIIVLVFIFMFFKKIYVLNVIF